MPPRDIIEQLDTSHVEWLPEKNAASGRFRRYELKIYSEPHRFSMQVQLSGIPSELSDGEALVIMDRVKTFLGLPP
jgi:hypothetical protein